jgi:hypothetical protein
MAVHCSVSCFMVANGGVTVVLQSRWPWANPTNVVACPRTQAGAASKGSNHRKPQSMHSPGQVRGLPQQLCSGSENRFVRGTKQVNNKPRLEQGLKNLFLNLTKVGPCPRTKAAHTRTKDGTRRAAFKDFAAERGGWPNNHVPD